MACCVAIVYVFSLLWRVARWIHRLLLGRAPVVEVGFAPPARRTVPAHTPDPDHGFVPVP